MCGVVEEVDDSDHLLSFKVGDTIIGTWDNYGVGGMSEYALVLTDRAALKPPHLTPEEGAALVNSLVHALKIVDSANIQTGDRVLVLGGSGAVGTAVVQMLRHTTASFVACTSTDTTLMTTLGAHCTVNYLQEKWWEVPAFQAEPFDVIIDCAEGSNGWARCGSVLKTAVQGGKWVAVVLNHWEIPMTAWHHVCAMACPLLCRMMGNGGLCCCCLKPCVAHSAPKYIMQMSEVKSEDIANTARYCEQHREDFKVVLHGNQAFPFTLEGVVDAFRTMENRKGHGNVVVKIAE